MNEWDNMNGMGDGAFYGAGGMPASALAWMLFAQTGYPGMYMLYSNLTHGERERSILD